MSSEPPQKRRKLAVSRTVGVHQSDAIKESQSTTELPLPQLQISLPQSILPTNQSHVPLTLAALIPEILDSTLAHLQTKYDLIPMSIISSSKMNLKVSALLSRLRQFSFMDLKAKPGVVVLYAKGDVAAKLISVVEIAKREIVKDNGKWYQYSRVSSRIEEMKVKVKAKENEATGKGGRKLNEAKGSEAMKTQEQMADEPDAEEAFATAPEDVQMEDQEQKGNESEDEEEAFETMEVKPANGGNEFSRKERVVPIMTIYMSMVPVPEFKTIYGEQTNAVMQTRLMDMAD